jgi:predicted GIY-YIG superfamily endonuclease
MGANARTAGTAVLPWFGHLSKQESLNLGKNKLVEGFTERYEVDKLVYYEQFQDAEYAIRREKRLKKYNRAWKIDLIEKANPTWKDLYKGLITGFPD